MTRLGTLFIKATALFACVKAKKLSVRCKTVRSIKICPYRSNCADLQQLLALQKLDPIPYGRVHLPTAIIRTFKRTKIQLRSSMKFCASGERSVTEIFAGYYRATGRLKKKLITKEVKTLLRCLCFRKYAHRVIAWN
jgi:hypothetical protein